MKGRILTLLRASKGVVSGETLCEQLRISGVSLEKHMGELKILGYDIEATPRGYRLNDALDALFPWEFPERESKIHYFEEAGSTMDIAKDLALEGCPHQTVVIAGRQTKGRGRLKRTWQSSDGGLYFTMVIRPKLSPAECFKTNFVASLVLCQTLRQRYDIPAMVKWPNDILVDGRKLSGMIAEMESQGGRVSFVTIGIGINVNNDPTSVEPNAVSLRKILNRNVSRRDLLTAFLDAFETQIEDIASHDVIAEWKRYTITLNHKVRIVTTHDVFEGMAIDVDRNGALLLEQPNGSVKAIVYGDCFLV